MIETKKNRRNVSDRINVFRHVLRYSYPVVQELGKDNELLNNYLLASWQVLFLNVFDLGDIFPVLIESYDCGGDVWVSHVLLSTNQPTHQIICSFKLSALSSFTSEEVEKLGPSPHNQGFVVDKFCTFQQLREKLGPEFEKECGTPAPQEFPPFEYVLCSLDGADYVFFVDELEFFIR